MGTLTKCVKHAITIMSMKGILLLLTNLVLESCVYGQDYENGNGNSAQRMPVDPTLIMADIPEYRDYEEKTEVVLNTGMIFVRQMYRDLLTGYDTRVRPVQNQSRPVYVNTKFVPMSLVDFDSANQKLSMMAYIRIHWVDEQMVWKPKQYAEISALRASLHELWTPNIVLHKVYYILYYIILYYIILYYIILYYIILYYIILRLCNNILFSIKVIDN